MYRQFFISAMTATSRQILFRRMLMVHLGLISMTILLLFTEFHSQLADASALLAGVQGRAQSTNLILFGYIATGLAMVEAAVLISWRLTQLPKSQALEFLLVSPLNPRRVFLAELSTGWLQFTLIWLSGLPLYSLLEFFGVISWADFSVLLILPYCWGIAVAIGLIVWVYESPIVRRIGEYLGLAGVLVYLIVGVLAGENLIRWLQFLPDDMGQFLFQGITLLHTMNPFGVQRYWFLPDSVDWIAEERTLWITGLAVVGVIALAGRAAFRLQPHFHDRHYRPISSQRAEQTHGIGDSPLSWWAVRRVMEYSGRVNLWLAGGFGILYAAFLILGDRWPDWLGKLVFLIFDHWGGAPMVAFGLAILSTVPAVFQYGLWDHSDDDRARRLELLLLSELDSYDYFRASLSAAWVRGRGYLAIAAMLWLALALGRHMTWTSAIALLLAAGLHWILSFLVGFQAFARGRSSSQTAMLMIIGLPTLSIIAWRSGFGNLAAVIPPGYLFLPLGESLSMGWFAGVLISMALTLRLYAQVNRCEEHLRQWLATH